MKYESLLLVKFYYVTVGAGVKKNKMCTLFWLSIITEKQISNQSAEISSQSAEKRKSESFIITKQQKVGKIVW